MKTVKVAVTGAAGQIGYSLLFRLASGEVFGPNVKVDINMLELPVAMKGAEGVAMELMDCAFSTCGEVNCYDNPDQAFDGVNWALLVGSKPRGPGMERGDLIKTNGPLFVAQGKALCKASSDLRAVVVGNPCNTNALIALSHCKEIPGTHFSAMTALDENRAKAQLAAKAGVSVADVKRLAIWGNHSSTMYPDFESALINDQAVTSVISDRKWLEQDFIKVVQSRGAQIIQARGKSSAASAASACIDHVKSFVNPTAKGDFFSAAVLTNGEWYDLPKGLVFSLPLRSNGDGHYEVVDNLEVSAFSRSKITTTCEELEKEKALVADFLA